MKLKDLYKLKWHFPKDSELVIKVDEQELKNFELEPKFTSEGKWILVIRANSKTDLKK